MTSSLKILGILLVLVGAAFWFTRGAHTGWTKTSVAVEKLDEITGIPYREYQKHFVPGIEIFAATTAIGTLLVTTGWWFGRKSRS